MFKFLVLAFLMTTTIFSEELKVTYLEFEDGEKFETIRYHSFSIDGKTKYVIFNTNGKTVEKYGKVSTVDIRMVNTDDLTKEAIINLKAHTDNKNKQIDKLVIRADDIQTVDEMLKHHREICTRLNLIANEWRKLKLTSENCKRQLDLLSANEASLEVEKQRISNRSYSSTGYSRGESLDAQQRISELQVKITEIRKQRIYYHLESKDIPNKMSQLQNEYQEIFPDLEALEKHMKENNVKYEVLRAFGF